MPRQKQKPPTKDDKKRWGLFGLIGCVACYLEHNYNAGYDIHHLLSGGRRRGHRWTVPLCPWHHRGDRPTDIPEIKSESDALEIIGPSLAKSPRMFHERYGEDERLLAITDKVIGYA